MRQTVSEDGARMAVLHVGLDPRLGVWSAMRALAAGQRASGLYAGVGCGVIADRRWPTLYEEELRATAGPWFRQGAPRCFGTAQAVALALQPSRLRAWAAHMRRATGAERVVVHVHAGWRTGALVPWGGFSTADTLLVSTFHGINPILAQQPVRRRLHAWLARRLMRLPGHLTSVDEANLARYRDLLGVPPARVHVIPNGVADTALRGCPFLAGGVPFTVGFVGSILVDKGWRVAAAAVESLLQRGVAVRLILAGTGPEEEEVRHLAARYPDAIQFRGQVAQARESVMPELDLLTLMSRYEGFPMTILEAMSLGIPVAATAVGDIPRQIEDGRTGFLLPGDPQVLAHLILELVRDPQRLRETGVRARQRYEAQFSIDRIVNRYHALYTGQLAPGVDGGGRA